MTLKGNDLEFALGYSHPINITAPEGVTFAVEGANLDRVGYRQAARWSVAANIRGLRKPDPCGVRGVRYAGEHIRRKVGKAGKQTYQVEGSAALPSSRSHPQVRFGYRCASAPVRHPFDPSHVRSGYRRCQGRNLASASTMEAELRAADLDKTAKAKRVGELVAERAKAAGVERQCSTAVVTKVPRPCCSRC